MKEEQHDVVLQMEEYTNADESFYVTASQVLNVAQRASEIFESSEVNEKRQILSFLLQNCRLSGKKLLFELRNPFDAIASYNPISSSLPLQNRFRTLNWRRIQEELRMVEGLISK